MTSAYSVLAGEAAAAWVRDPINRDRWSRLVKRCPWATVFLGPGFFDVWTRHYGARWTPLIAWRARADGELAALMPLAMLDGTITGVGAHQAEYHGWLSDVDDVLATLRGCADAVRAQFPGCEIRLQYLHAGVPPHAIDEFCAYEPRAVAERFQRHRLKLDAASINEVLRKKGNKSKLNRLARLGRLDLKRLDADAFGAHLDETAALCDFRQGAVNDSCPFTDDPAKRAFHADMLKDLGTETQASGLFLDERLISSILFMVSADEAHVAILAHAPDHASNSPNKIHFYQAALMLAADGLTYVDMTPGGDDWKARFGTESDLVTRLTIHRSPARAAQIKVQTNVMGAAKSAAGWMGLSPSAVRRLLSRQQQRERTPDPSNRNWLRVTLDAATLARRPEPSVRVNDFARLLSDGPGLAGLPRQRFLAEATLRMEAGQVCYSAGGARTLNGFGWAAFEDGVLLRLFDFHVRAGASAGETYERIALGALRNALSKATPGHLSVAFDPEDDALRLALTRLGAVPC